jgi:hypothetical protein
VVPRAARPIRQRALNLFPLPFTPPLTLALACALMLLAGCSGDRAAMEEPRDRMGALPFPGAFTLYHASDPNFLGDHCYERSAVLAADEANGIVYTTRAGFIDLAHVRITVDTLRFCTERIREGIAQGQSSVTLTTLEGSRFIVELPDTGIATAAEANEQEQEQQQAERRRLIDELSLRLGQRVTYLMMTWHEVLTWFGYRTVSWIDESPSAFTWDDSMSHVIGLRVAERVLREQQQPQQDVSFDEAVTSGLRAELIEVGVVPPAQTDRAVRAVQGWWWLRSKPLKRQLDIGLRDEDDNTVHPWLVPGFAPADSDSNSEAFALPTLRDVLGQDWSSSYSIRIDPLVPQAQSLRDALPSRPAVLDGERDMPLLVEVTRRQMQGRLSANVDQPWEKVATYSGGAGPQRVSLAPGGGSARKAR